MNKLKTMDLGKKLEKLDEYETLLENSNSPDEIYQLIEKIETLLAEIEILEKNIVYQSSRSYVPINDGDISGNRGVRWVETSEFLIY